MLAVLEPQIANYRLTGEVKPRTGSRSTNTAPRNAYPTKDGGWVCLSASTQGMTEKLLKSIGRPELIDDPRFRTNADRLNNSDAIDAIVAEFIAARTTAENLAHFDQAGVTIGPIMDAAGLADDDYVATRESMIEVPDAEVGWLPMHGAVPRLSGTPGILARPAPTLGEHNAEILSRIMSEDARRALEKDGIVRAE
jgi:crotonobetainyl-CoA:carnitine CoA-transferase CaiB-like acyl-CoA transferase